MRRLLLYLYIIIGMPLSAQSLAECRRLARENYPLLRSYDVLSATSAYTLEAATKGYLPQISAAAQASWQNAVPNYPDALADVLRQRGVDFQGLRRDQYRIGVDVQQTLWDGGRIKAAQNATRAELLEKQAALQVEFYALDARVDEVYFALLLLERQKESLEASILLIEGNLARLEAMQRHGTAMQSDVDALRAELLGLQATRESILSAAQGYRAVLSLYIGRPVEASLPIPAAPAAASPSSSPTMALFEQQKRTLLMREGEVKSAVLPKFSFFATGFYGYPGFDSMDAMLSHRWTWNAQVGLRLSWNIAALYTKKSSLGLLQTAAQQVEVQRSLFSFNQRIRAAAENTEISRLRRLSANDEEILALRSNVRKAEEARLREGVVNTTDLLRKITDERAAEIAAATHQLQLLQAYYQLNHTLEQ